jgi:hypothetical protein
LASVDQRKLPCFRFRRPIQKIALPRICKIHHTQNSATIMQSLWVLICSRDMKEYINKHTTSNSDCGVTEEKGHLVINIALYPTLPHRLTGVTPYTRNLKWTQRHRTSPALVMLCHSWLFLVTFIVILSPIITKNHQYLSPFVTESNRKLGNFG